MTYRVELIGKGGVRMVDMPGTVTEEQWEEKRKQAEKRYSSRKGKSTVHREKGMWVANEGG
jgi:hypothetical protein